MIQTAEQLKENCLKLANHYKTLYVMGCFGAPMTPSNQERYIAHHSYNQRKEQADMIRSADGETFGFDCVCMIKGLLWGWNGNPEHIYGGASYTSNGIPDIGADQIILVCREQSTDFGAIQPGELLWTKGHVGIYVGNGDAVECTPGWKNGVQVTAVKNIKSGAGHNWTKHGKLPYISYDDGKIEPELDGIPVLRRGTKSDAVRLAQILLNHRSKKPYLAVDGSFGPATEEVFRSFQKDNGLKADGICGAESWKVLLRL